MSNNNGHHTPSAGEARDAVLVTGAAGFGGSHLVRSLLKLGYRVTGLDIVPPSHADLLRREMDHPNFRYRWQSLQDLQPGDVDGHSVVAHLAAQADTPNPQHGSCVADTTNASFNRRNGRHDLMPPETMRTTPGNTRRRQITSPRPNS